MAGLETSGLALRLGGSDRRPHFGLRRRRPPRPHPLTFETLEVRFVLSGQFGYFSAAPAYATYPGEILTDLGIITGYVFPATGEQPGRYGDDDRNLDLEFQALAAKSGVTVADLTNL